MALLVVIHQESRGCIPHVDGAVVCAADEQRLAIRVMQGALGAAVWSWERCQGNYSHRRLPRCVEENIPREAILRQDTAYCLSKEMVMEGCRMLGYRGEIGIRAMSRIYWLGGWEAVKKIRGENSPSA